jgi:hypothetical protein
MGRAGGSQREASPRPPLAALLAAGLALGSACFLVRPPFLGYGCDEDAHRCNNGEVCVQGRCAAPCEGDRDCARRFSCIGGGCLLTDGGVLLEGGELCFGSPEQCAPAAEVVCIGAAGPCADTRRAATIEEALLRPVSPTGRRTLFLSAGDHDETVRIADAEVALVGEEGSRIAASRGPALVIAGASLVRVTGLELTSSADSDLIDVNDAARLILARVVVGPGRRIGVDAQAETDVVLVESLVRDCFRGGAILRGRARVESSAFLRNGNDRAGANGSPFGGIHLGGAPEDVVFRFNTLAHNASQQQSAVVCSQPVVLDSIISWANEGTDIDSDCVVVRSDVEGLSGAGPDAGNFSADPLLEDGGFHLADLSSPCIDVGNPDAPARDIDGEERPLGAGPDVGADEAG